MCLGKDIFLEQKVYVVIWKGGQNNFPLYTTFLLYILYAPFGLRIPIQSQILLSARSHSS